MKTALVYLYVAGTSPGGAQPLEVYEGWWRRFIGSYREFRGDQPHDLVVVGCGPVEMGQETTPHMVPEAAAVLLYRGGGWDIGAYQWAALQLRERYHFAIFMNTSMYFWRPGFIEQMVRARLEHGPGMYGPTASYESSPHIRTCCFGCDPRDLVRYPHQVDNRTRTFRAESGDWSLTRWFEKHSQERRMVAADGIDYEEWTWRDAPNIFRRGDQSNCLVWDRHTDIYAAAGALEKQDLERRANGK